VRAAIQSIVQDIEQNLNAHGLWPAHSLDEIADEPREEFKSLYLGAAGVLWALWYLEREGVVTLRLAAAERIGAVDDAYQADTDHVVPSYFMGEVGILLVRSRLAGSSAVTERLWRSIQQNIANPSNEALWGAPGTMVGALHMLAWTAEPRWRDLFVDNVEQLWRTWLPDERAGWLWTQELDCSVQLLGAGHGFAGNVYPLLRGASLLDSERREQLHDRCVTTLRATAVWDDDAVNWPNSITAPRPGRPVMLVQWCSGAPGIVTALADFPPGRSPDLDAMLVGAGTTVWKAGPPTKGYGLCHGTAGNGYAFLKLHRRTGDPVWLARARSFAMHALAQRDDMRRRYGRGRYSLWTGDPGLAVYLWHCLVGGADVPGIDLL